MIFLLGIIQLVAIINICIFEFKQKSIAIFMWAILLVMFGIPHFICTLTNSFYFSIDTMNTASLFVILFCITYIIGRNLFAKKNSAREIKRKINISELNSKNYKKFMLFLFIMLVILVLLRLMELIRSAGNIFNTSWVTMRNTEGDYFSFSQFFIPFYFMSSSCLIMALKVKNKKIICLSSLIMVFEVIISRNRIEILPLAVSIIYYIILQQKKLNLKNMIILCLVGIFGIYAVYGLRVFRHAGTLSNFLERYDFITFNQTVLDYFENDDGELGLRNYFYYFIENDNNFENFNKGHTYIRMILGILPTQWSLGLKPSDFAISMGKAVNPKISGYSVHPTLFGDVYANFGIYGFLFGFVWSIFLTLIDKIANKKNKITFLPFLMIWASVFIIQARGSVYNGYIWGVYASIFLYVIWMLFKFIMKIEKIDK